MRGLVIGTLACLMLVFSGASFAMTPAIPCTSTPFWKNKIPEAILNGDVSEVFVGNQDHVTLFSGSQEVVRGSEGIRKFLKDNYSNQGRDPSFVAMNNALLVMFTTTKKFYGMNGAVQDIEQREGFIFWCDDVHGLYKIDLVRENDWLTHVLAHDFGQQDTVKAGN